MSRRLKITVEYCEPTADSLRAEAWFFGQVWAAIWRSDALAPGRASEFHPSPSLLTRPGASYLDTRRARA